MWSLNVFRGGHIISRWFDWGLCTAAEADNMSRHDGPHMLPLASSAQRLQLQETSFFGLFTLPLLSLRPNALPQCPLRQTETNGTTAAAVIDRDLYGGMSEESDGVVYRRSSPPHLSGSTWQHFWAKRLRGRYAGVFFSHPHKQMHQAKSSQAADGRRCQMHEKKNILFRPKLCIWERCAFSIRA